LHTNTALSKTMCTTELDALLGEVLTTCEKIRCICSEGEGWLRSSSRKPGPLMVHKSAYVEYSPLGVLGVIAPWNYPFHNVYNHIVSGIFAGNAVVSKVSEYTSWSSRYFGAIMSAALVACGHSPDLCATVTGFGEAGAALVASPGVAKIIFTGSPGVGKAVMAGAAPHLKPVVLELGGKDPMVLCEDVNVLAILPMAMRGVYQNCGQNCCGIERIYAYEGVYEAFCAAALANVRQLRQGPPLGDAPVDCGAMVMPAQLSIVQALVDDAVQRGARLLAGGKRNAAHPNGLFYEPTILAGVTHEMRIAREEVFGPVMCILRVPGNDDAAAVRMVNDCAYGLGSSVFSGNQKRAIRIAEQLRCGMATVNDFGVNYLVQALPFGGIKHR
jgi:acyl-CoA reductase-like NAD-dependent aldehyde dehydrogenase